jgi:hypothetical protein
LTPSEDLTPFDPGVPFQDTVVEEFESTAAARAFASLPERWQMVLWHLEVECQKPAEIAPLLGMTANSVSALAYRAREGLRQAFLSAHLAETQDTDCCWAVNHMGGYVRNGLSRRDADKMSAHLGGCRSCTAMHLELIDVNSDLSAILGPVLLGGLAAGYACATGSGAGVLGAAGALLDRGKDFVTAHLMPVAATTTAAGVATAVVVIGGVGIGGGFQQPGASSPPAPGSTKEAESAVFTELANGTSGASGKHRDQSGDADHAGPRTAPGRPGSRPSPSTSSSPSGAATTEDPEAKTSPGASPAGTDAGTSPPQAENPDQPDQTDQPDETDQPDQPSPTPRPSPDETESHDIAIRVDGSVIAKDIGRFRTHVTGLPTASGDTPLHFDVEFTDDRVHLESVPNGCSLEGSGDVDCSGGSGASWNGVFDADLSGLAPGDPVTITVTVSADVNDPYTGNNYGSITLNRSGAARMLGMH